MPVKSLLFGYSGPGLNTELGIKLIKKPIKKFVFKNLIIFEPDQHRWPEVLRKQHSADPSRPSPCPSPSLPQALSARPVSWCV